jgi:hypothetical protein
VGERRNAYEPLENIHLQDRKGEGGITFIMVLREIRCYEGRCVE